MMIMWKPKYFHEMITNSVIITSVESPSQSWISPSRPTVFSDAVDDRIRLQHQREDDAGRRPRTGRTAGRTAGGGPPGRGNAG